MSMLVISTAYGCACVLVAVMRMLVMVMVMTTMITIELLMKAHIMQDAGFVGIC